MYTKEAFETNNHTPETSLPLPLLCFPVLFYCRISASFNICLIYADQSFKVEKQTSHSKFRLIWLAFEQTLPFDT